MDDTARQATRLEAIGGHYDKWLLGAIINRGSWAHWVIFGLLVAALADPPPRLR